MPPPFVLRDLQRARGLPRDVLRGQLPQLAEQLTPVAEQADADRLVAALNLSDEVRAQIGALDTSKGADDVISQLRTRLAALQVSQSDIDSIVQDTQRTASQISSTDVPGTQPGIARQIELARVQAVGGIAGLDAATSASLSAAATDPRRTRSRWRHQGRARTRSCISMEASATLYRCGPRKRTQPWEERGTRVRSSK